MSSINGGGEGGSKGGMRVKGNGDRESGRQREETEMGVLSYARLLLGSRSNTRLRPSRKYRELRPHRDSFRTTTGASPFHACHNNMSSE